LNSSRQRRWWNAYILFYEKISDDELNPENSLAKDLAQLQLCIFIKFIYFFLLNFCF